MTTARVTAAFRRARSVELALEGDLTYQQIADQVGYAHRGSVSKAISRALNDRTVEAVDQLRLVELDRLDRLQAAIWDQALDGNLAAVTTIVRILDKRAKLLGLYRENSAQAEGSTLLLGHGAPMATQERQHDKATAASARSVHSARLR